MSSHNRGRDKGAAWAVLFAGLFASVALAVIFVVLQVTGNSAAFSLSQLAYVAPPALAAIACIGAALNSRRASRERTMWVLLFAMMAPIAIGEASYSWYQVFVDPAGPQGFSFTEVAWFVGAAMLLVLAVCTSGLTNLDAAEQVRVLADVGVGLAFLFTVFYAAWAASPVLAFGTTEDAALAAGYSVQSVVSLLVALTFWLADRKRPAPSWVRVLAVAFFVYGTGLFVWPMWSTAQHSGSLLNQFGPELVYLFGYCMLATAAVVRLVGAECWEPPVIHQPTEVVSPWPGVTISAGMFVATGILVGLSIAAHPRSPSESIFFGATAVAVVGILVRSAASSLEQGQLRGRALTDPLTGVGNHRAFFDLMPAAIGDARRCESSASLVVIDIDDLGLVNETAGFREGDAVLQRAAATLSRVVGHAGSVFRVSGDVFAFVTTRLDSPALEDLVRRITLELRKIRTDAGTLTVSVGVARFPSDASGAEDLWQSAEAAQIWAKCHGKNRVVWSRTGVLRKVDPEDRLRLMKEGVRLDLARGLAAAVDARDSSNRYHSRNVAALATLVGENLGFDIDRLVQLEAAALLHDVGTLALPDEVLFSASRLARLRQREHAELGEAFSSSIGFADVAHWVRSHHEHWDGSGYPDSISGSEIPKEARIIALCDAYDLLTGGKSGRPALSRGAALQEIDQGMGSHFDPQLAERFIAIVGGHGGLGWIEASEEEAS